MNLFSIFTIFDWITPTYEIGRSVKRAVQGKDDHYLFVADGAFSKNIGAARAALDRIGIPYRCGVGAYNFLNDSWTIEISYEHLATAQTALEQAGVKFKG